MVAMDEKEGGDRRKRGKQQRDRGTQTDKQTCRKAGRKTNKERLLTLFSSATFNEYFKL